MRLDLSEMDAGDALSCAAASRVEIGSLRPNWAHSNIEKYRSGAALRDLSKGERAMGHAMLYPIFEKEKGGRGNKKVGETPGFSAKRLFDARKVFGSDPELAQRVRDGVVSLDKALAEVRLLPTRAAQRNMRLQATHFDENATAAPLRDDHALLAPVANILIRLADEAGGGLERLPNLRHRIPCGFVNQPPVITSQRLDRGLHSGDQVQRERAITIGIGVGRAQIIRNDCGFAIQIAQIINVAGGVHGINARRRERRPRTGLPVPAPPGQRGCL
jgi:hypothetical protein